MEIKSNVLEEYKIKIEESQGIKMIFVYNKEDKYIGTLKDFEMYIEKYASIIIGIFEKEHCCENCREAVDNFINKRKEYFSDKNNFNM